jgi:dTMP kinase
MENRSTFGRFITFEGGEGAGKSTQIKELARRLLEQETMAQTELVITREPGGSPIAEKIRELLVAGKPGDLEQKAELMLVMAARIEHVQKLIYPVLRRGGWVLCDRFVDSTLAYQGYGRGMHTDHLIMLNQWALGGLRPDLTLLLDVEHNVGLARTHRLESDSQNAKVKDRFEMEDETFHMRVNEGFRQLARSEPDRIHIIDANQDSEIVSKAIWEVLSGVFPNF